MKIAYFDCFSGISGDMVLGALIDAGLNIRKLKAELAKLKLSDYRIKTQRVLKGGISGIKFSLSASKQKQKRHLKDIIGLIEKSRLDCQTKKLSKTAFTELAKVEAKIHGKNINQVHFHEIGALDAIVEIIGSLVGIKLLGIEHIYSSKLQLGSGFVNCGHGTLPVPSPATLALLTGIPVYSQDIAAELVTPTGASIIRTVCSRFGPMPPMKITKIGYGAGEKELAIPNLLRIYLGESIQTTTNTDQVMLIETNIDDRSPEVLGYVCERLSAQGALDVFTTPIMMKKTRLATMLSVLTEPAKIDQMLSIIFDETSTFGVRIQSLERRKLLREVFTINTEFGGVEVKVGKIGRQIKTVAPEYESCKKIAIQKKVPLQTVYDRAKRLATRKLSSATT